MSYEEKVLWVSGVVTLIVAGMYAWTVGGRLGQGPVADIAYVRPLLFAVGGMIVLSIVGSIVMAIGTAIAAEITGDGSADDVDRKDERDASIGARGDRVAFYVCTTFMVGVLGMAILEMDHFWIANATFAALVAAGLLSTVVKLVAYRRGL